MEAAEKRKLAELQAEISAERNREDLRRVGQASGIIAGDDGHKLEWMYRGPKENLNREDYLLGRTVDKTYEQFAEDERATEKQDHLGVSVPKNHVEYECVPFSIRAYKDADPTTVQVDMARKMAEDPLQMIKQREMESRKKLLENPVKLKELKQLLQSEKGQGRSKKSKKDKESKSKKKSKKDSSKKKKKKRSRSKSSSSDSSDSGSDVDDALLAMLSKQRAVVEDEVDMEDLNFEEMVNLKYNTLNKELDKMIEGKPKKGGPEEAPGRERDSERDRNNRNNNYSNGRDGDRRMMGRSVSRERRTDVRGRGAGDDQRRRYQSPMEYHRRRDDEDDRIRTSRRGRDEDRRRSRSPERRKRDYNHRSRSPEDRRKEVSRQRENRRSRSLDQGRNKMKTSRRSKSPEMRKRDNQKYRSKSPDQRKSKEVKRQRSKDRSRSPQTRRRNNNSRSRSPEVRKRDNYNKKNRSKSPDNKKKEGSRRRHHSRSMSPDLRNKDKHRSDSPEHRQKRDEKRDNTHEMDNTPRNDKPSKTIGPSRPSPSAIEKQTKSMREKSNSPDSSSDEEESTTHKRRDHDSDDDDRKSKAPVHQNWGLVTATGKSIALKNDAKTYTDRIASASAKEPSKSETSWKKPASSRPKLTEAEKEEKLREMMKNAEWRNVERESYVRKYHEDGRKEEDKHREAEFDRNFINKELHKSAQSATVESRLKSNRNNIQRSSGAMNTNFARRN